MEQPERAEAMNPELRAKVEERAYTMWENDGRPDGMEIEYWLKAEQEIVNQSAVGEEDPMPAVEKPAKRAARR
jgi:hypothetical protein